MEVAVIDWKSIDTRFVEDELYEYINAPKWVDFSAPDDPVDDEAWFCRPNCDHPKTAEDFLNEKLRTPTSNSKLQRSVSVSDIPPFGDRNKRDATLKKRGINQPFATIKDTNYHRVVEDGENQDPNFSTPLIHKAKLGKGALKSSTEKKQIKETMTKKEQTPKLRSTLSARNLFSGGDLLNKVAEFCNELKKIATRTRDKETAVDVDRNNVEKHQGKDHSDENLGVLNDKEKERKPLLELPKVKSEAIELSGSKGQQRRKKRNDDAENTPISVDVKNIKHQEGAEGLLQIRTCPPTPQCFSANRGPLKSTTPKPFRPRPLNQERGILQELKQMNKEVVNRVEREEKTSNHGGEAAEKEARSLDVFWFLKPCTLSS
ncbi:uncharacterized protein LOC105173465 isoform X1 [Sesamum indicum]|uniref:Uncharacterized protein LOC105173465 isoform X1 n=1 Tax=Sesamum indicum TaxID=4182 RepID=A0A6I9U733_SESIN|nr:uncharacterized protein LOC105173465 isoform X1 [Sesamum indicum]